MSKYLSTNPLQSEKIKQQTQRKLLEQYGATNPMHVDQFKQKRQETIVQRYGVDSPLKNQQILNKKLYTCRQVNFDTFIERLRTKHIELITSREQFVEDNSVIELKCLDCGDQWQQ